MVKKVMETKGGRMESCKHSMVQIKIDDGTCDAYEAFPATSDTPTGLPAVLLYMDAIGLRPRIEQMAKKIASHGYYVLAPNLFYRLRPAPILDYARLLKPENRPELLKEIMPLVTATTSDMIKNDGRHYLAFAADRTKGTKAGVTGYCMGGRQALLMAANFPENIQAVASFHGGNLATDAEDSPHKKFQQIKAEIYIGHADQDKSMPPEQMEKIEVALKQAQVRGRAELFEGCAHGWTMSDLPAHNEAGEHKHWERLFDLFSRNL